MFKTALAQLRIAASLGLGRPFSLSALDYLINAGKETGHEFGTIEAEEGAGRLGGPCSTRRSAANCTFAAS